MANDLIASMVLAIWLYLLAARGGFWRRRERDDDGPPARLAPWPAVAAVIPARDEAECVGETVASLLRQDYPGAFAVILVDDQSRDGTAQVARDAAAALGAGNRLTVLPGRALPAGWTGKLWAQHQGVDRRAKRRSRRTICCSPTPTSSMRPTRCPAWWRGRKPAASCSPR